jgi:hypothetical protein
MTADSQPRSIDGWTVHTTRVLCHDVPLMSLIGEGLHVVQEGGARRYDAGDGIGCTMALNNQGRLNVVLCLIVIWVGRLQDYMR